MKNFLFLKLTCIRSYSTS